MFKKTGNYIQKANFIELKTLEYIFGDIEKAKRVFDIRHKLTSTGFELYIKYYLNNMGFKMCRKNGGLKADGGIDLKCKNPPLYVQCKKYFQNNKYRGNVNIGEVRNFYGSVVSLYKGNIQNKNIIMLFATTGSFTHDSKKFSRENNIDLLDLEDIGIISGIYTLHDFLTEFESKGFKIENIVNNYCQLEINQMQFSFSDLLEDDIFLYLKNIRADIVEKLDIKEDITGLILSDHILKEIANKRISSIGGLKEFYKNYKNEYEKDHLLSHIKELEIGLKVINNGKLNKF